MSHPILDLPMGKNDPNAKTVRDYLKELLHTLINEQECFSGKRPFGNSGWIGELEEPLIRACLVQGKINEEGYAEECDSDAASVLLLGAIKDL
jgi:hypothetical protein